MSSKKTELELRRLGYQQNLYSLLAMRRDFPDKTSRHPRNLRPVAGRPPIRRTNTSLAKGKSGHVLARLHNYDPADKEACPIWDTIQEAKAFRTMTDGMKYFLGAVGVVTLFLGGLGVMNVMLVAVRDAPANRRTQSHGAPRTASSANFF